jgi:hypothetical protein
MNSIDLQNNFKNQHDKMMHLLQSLQPEGTSRDETAALLAFNLLVMAGQRNSPLCTNFFQGTPVMQGMSPIAEHGGPAQMYTQSPPPATLQHVRRQPLPVGPVWMPPMFNHIPTQIPMIGRVPSVEPVARAPSLGLDARSRSRRLRKYDVINPSTGERITIRCKVEFRWRESKRMRIIDPETGREVPPEVITSKDFQTAPARASIGSSRLSTDSTSSARGPSETRRSQRRSVAGRAVHDGRSWAIEPANGSFWDWPLSRQEKKDRVIILQQLEMLEEIHELKEGKDM